MLIVLGPGTASGSLSGQRPSLIPTRRLWLPLGRDTGLLHVVNANLPGKAVAVHLLLRRMLFLYGKQHLILPSIQDGPLPGILQLWGEGDFLSL